MRFLALLVGALGVVVTPVIAHSESTSSLSLGAQPDSLLRRFDAANEAYMQGRYEQAVKDYRALLDAGYASGALYNNLGNAYVRLDRVGPAVWAYERGRRLRPDDPRLRHNLQYVRRREGLPLRGIPPRGLAALVEGWSPLFLFVAGWLVFGAGLGAAVYKAGPDDRFGDWHPSAWGPVAAGLMLVAVALGTSYLQAHEQRAVVIVEQATLRNTPANTAPPDTTVEAGTMLEVRARRSQWTRVRLGDQTLGWVPAGALGDV